MQQYCTKSRLQKMRECIFVILISMIFMVGCFGCAPESNFTLQEGVVGSMNSFDSLFIMPDGVETRWASPENWKGRKGVAAQVNAGRKGSANFPLKAGESKVLAEVTGTSGIVRRIWITISDRSAKMLRSLMLDVYWDGVDKPAVSAPLGDFFCHGLGRMAKFESALFSSPEGRSFNCCVPMPFRTGMKIVVTNEGDTDLLAMYYDVDYTIGNRLSDDVLYFHAHYRRENPTKLKQDYVILPKVEGSGRFLGVNIGVIANQERYSKSWWGEGEVKIYLDGDDKFPTLAGTGTEDYIGSAYGQGQYSNLYQGCSLADKENMQYCFYRFHVPDPVYFRRDIRATIQQIGCWDPESKVFMYKLGEPIYHAGDGLVEIDFSESGNTGDYGLFERQDDWSSCAYFYLDKPVSNLPSITSVEKRQVP